MDFESKAKRIWMIDVARFYGIALVFYGHFIERIMHLGLSPGAAHYKFIYSFHMMLFFVLAGYIFKGSDLELSFPKYLKLRCLTRLLPFLFFNCLLIALTFFFSGDFFGLQLPSVQGYSLGALLTVFGFTVFNIPTWFLLCLFSVELIHYFAFKYLKSNSKILIGALVFYVLGYLLNWRFTIFNPIRGRIVGYNYLYIHEALVLYSFYLVGVYFRRKKFLMGKIAPMKLIFGLIITFLFVFFTYNLNKGPFKLYDAVLVMLSDHGNILLFPATAIVGSIFILLLAKLTSSQKLFILMGKNALALFCLNGIFYHFINARIAKWVVTNFSSTPLILSGVGILVTLASLIACVPILLFFNKFIPQLIGKPKIDGPLFKKFI